MDDLIPENHDHTCSCPICYETRAEMAQAAINEEYESFLQAMSDDFDIH